MDRRLKRSISELVRERENRRFSLPNLNFSLREVAFADHMLKRVHRLDRPKITDLEFLKYNQISLSYSGSWNTRPYLICLCWNECEPNMNPKEDLCKTRPRHVYRNLGPARSSSEPLIRKSPVTSSSSDRFSSTEWIADEPANPFRDSELDSSSRSTVSGPIPESKIQRRRASSERSFWEESDSKVSSSSSDYACIDLDGLIQPELEWDNAFDSIPLESLDSRSLNSNVDDTMQDASSSNNAESTISTTNAPSSPISILKKRKRDTLRETASTLATGTAISLVLCPNCHRSSKPNGNHHGPSRIAESESGSKSSRPLDANSDLIKFSFDDDTNGDAGDPVKLESTDNHPDHDEPDSNVTASHHPRISHHLSHGVSEIDGTNSEHVRNRQLVSPGILNPLHPVDHRDADNFCHFDWLFIVGNPSEQSHADEYPSSASVGSQNPDRTTESSDFYDHRGLLHNSLPENKVLNDHPTRSPKSSAYKANHSDPIDHSLPQEICASTTHDSDLAAKHNYTKSDCNLRQKRVHFSAHVHVHSIPARPPKFNTSSRRTDQFNNFETRRSWRHP